MTTVEAAALLRIDRHTFTKWWDQDRGGWVIPTVNDPRGLLIRAVPVGREKRVSRPRLLSVLETMTDEVA